MDHSSTPVSDPNSLLRALLASSGDCIKILDLDGNLIYMTEGGQRIMEVSDFGAIKGCPWPDFWQDKGNADAKAAVAAAREGKTGHFQGFATTMAGTPKWWDVTVTLIRDAEASRTDCSPSRATSRNRGTRELAVRESEARFKTYAQAMPNQVWSATPDGQLDWFNDQVFSYSGLKVRRTGRLGMGANGPCRRHRACGRKLGQGARDRKAVSGRISLRQHDGAWRWHLARALPIKDAAGAITRWIGTNTDIDDRKAAEAQQQLLARELEHRMKNTMAMVGAIANQTFRTAATKEDARTIFDARLRALNQAHDVLVASSWTSAPMSIVIDGALAPHRTGEGRIHVNGPAGRPHGQAGALAVARPS